MAFIFLDRIHPIRLPQIGEIIEDGSEVIVSGWGRISEDSQGLSPFLYYANLTTISNAKCASVYGDSIVIDSTLCAIGNPQHSTCDVSNLVHLLSLE